MFPYYHINNLSTGIKQMGKLSSIDFTIDNILKISSDSTNNSDGYSFSEYVLFNNVIRQFKEFTNSTKVRNATKGLAQKHPKFFIFSSIKDFINLQHKIRYNEIQYPVNVLTTSNSTNSISSGFRYNGEYFHEKLINHIKNQSNTGDFTNIQGTHYISSSFMDFMDFNEIHRPIFETIPSIANKVRRNIHCRRFTTFQNQYLQKVYKNHQYLTPGEKKLLALTLCMTEKQVKTWFQNKRAKTKKERPENQCQFFR